jgi:hypothetical protein
MQCMADEEQFFSVSRIAVRWDCSESKVTRMVEKYRGRKGFLDLGHGDQKRKRKYAIIRIHSVLLKEIEGETT